MVSHMVDFQQIDTDSLMGTGACVSYIYSKTCV